MKCCFCTCQISLCSCYAHIAYLHTLLILDEESHNNNYYYQITNFRGSWMDDEDTKIMIVTKISIIVSNLHLTKTISYLDCMKSENMKIWSSNFQMRVSVVFANVGVLYFKLTVVLTIAFPKITTIIIFTESLPI